MPEVRLPSSDYRWIRDYFISLFACHTQEIYLHYEFIINNNTYITWHCMPRFLLFLLITTAILLLRLITARPTSPHLRPRKCKFRCHVSSRSHASFFSCSLLSRDDWLLRHFYWHAHLHYILGRYFIRRRHIKPGLVYGLDVAHFRASNDRYLRFYIFKYDQCFDYRRRRGFASLVATFHCRASVWKFHALCFSASFGFFTTAWKNL